MRESLGFSRKEIANGSEISMKEDEGILEEEYSFKHAHQVMPDDCFVVQPKTERQEHSEGSCNGEEELG